MLRDLLSSRVIQVGLVFFLLIVAGTQLYSWRVRRTTETKLERAKQNLQALINKNQNKKRPAQVVDDPSAREIPDRVDTRYENTDTPMSTETSVLSNKTERHDIAGAFEPNNIVSAEEPAEVRVSPHGFGPYPPIPEGAPIAEFDETDSVEMELLLRVAIKKWNEGYRFVGASIANGKVYLNYPNTLYIKWGDPQEDPDGNVFLPIVRTSGPGDLVLTPEQMHSGKIPKGVTALDLDSEGLDPYEVLELPE